MNGFARNGWGQRPRFFWKTVAFSPPDMPMTPSRGRNGGEHLGHRDAVDIGHLDVGQDQVDSPIVVLNQLEAGLTVRRLQHDIAFVRQHATHDRTRSRVVVDHKDREGRGSRGAGRVCGDRIRTG